MTIAMGVSFLTVFVNPFLSSQSDKVFAFTNKYVPGKLKFVFDVYYNAISSMSTAAKKSEYLGAIAGPLVRIGIYTLLFNGLLIVAIFFRGVFDSEAVPIVPNEWFDIVYWLLVAALSLPIVMGVIMNVGRATRTIISMTPLVKEGSSGMVAALLRVVFSFFIAILFAFFYFAFVWHYLPSSKITIVFFAAVVLLALVFWKIFAGMNSSLESKFTEVFQRHLANAEHHRHDAMMESIKKSYKWAIETGEAEITELSLASGKTVGELAVRAQTGAEIAAIKRGRFVIYNIMPDTQVFPDDIVVLSGQPEDVAKAEKLLAKQLDDIERGIDEVQSSHGEQFTVKQLMKTRKAIVTKLEKLNDTKRKDTVIDFEQLGVDRLFIDESHFYKNLYLYTKMRNVGGIAQTEAQKSSDLFMKCRYLDEITGNRGVIFATGTPVSNSMVELYSVQRYLQYDTLLRNGLQHFDAWASTFGETITALELAPEGTNYRAKTRFAKFHNLPELMLMFREIADIQTADMLKLPVPKVNYHNIKVAPSDIQKEMVASLAKRAEKVRTRAVEPQVDNMLKITNDGRKLALDQRLIDPMLPDDAGSKVNACVDNVYRIWEEHADTRAAQLLFCDLSTPKGDGTFNIYDDIREKLVQRGIPAEQIRFIHEAATDAKKKELFAKVRSGEVRILLGSTQKMGAGTNVQDRLIAIHNLDCPWRPSDLEQRQGRIERQGNMFPEVEVYRYVTEQTFDAYLYQLVESKQKFIAQVMTSKSPVRSAEDVDEVALSFAEVKMLATGDERFKEKMDLDIQVSKLKVLKQSYLSEHYDLEDKILQYYPKQVKEYEEYIEGYSQDVKLAGQHQAAGEEKFCPMTLKGVVYTEKADAGEMLLAVCKENPLSAPVEIGSYRGFRMEVYYDTLNAHYCLNLCGKMKHTVSLGTDALGNLTRIENEISKFPARLDAAKTKKAETLEQIENAKVEFAKREPR